MRVLHVGKFYPPHRGGMETHLEQLCGELKQAVELQVLVANKQSRTLREWIQEVPVTRAGSLTEVAATPICPQMVRVLRESAADVVHLHWPNPMAVLAYLASGHRGHLVFTYHSDVIRQRMLAKAFQPVLECAIRRSKAVITSSPDYVESSPVLWQHRDRCRIIPFGIPVKRFECYDRGAVERIRSRYGPRLVLTLGRQVYYKGFEYLVRAMRMVDGRALLIGDGPLRKQLEKVARDLRVQDRVFFIGEVEDTIPYYHAADIFAFPSVERSEAFGIVQLEAMACGKPVVNTQLASGVPFVSLHGVTGLTVPPRDSEELASAINILLDNAPLRAQYGEAARRRVVQEFSVEKMGERTLALYQEIMEFPAHHQSTVSVP